MRRGVNEACWGRDSGAYFDGALHGTPCNADWYEGSIGWQNYVGDTPALLGFDDSIASYCARNARQQGRRMNRRLQRAPSARGRPAESPNEVSGSHMGHPPHAQRPEPYKDSGSTSGGEMAARRTENASHRSTAGAGGAPGPRRPPRWSQAAMHTARVGWNSTAPREAAAQGRRLDAQSDARNCIQSRHNILMLFGNNVHGTGSGYNSCRNLECATLHTVCRLHFNRRVASSSTAFASLDCSSAVSGPAAFTSILCCLSLICVSPSRPFPPLLPLLRRWQMCAAMGKLPGQQTPTIVFAHAPASLDTHGRRPLGRCGGYHPNGCPPRKSRYRLQLHGTHITDHVHTACIPPRQWISLESPASLNHARPTGTSERTHSRERMRLCVCAPSQGDTQTMTSSSWRCVHTHSCAPIATSFSSCAQSSRLHAK